MKSIDTEITSEAIGNGMGHNVYVGGMFIGAYTGPVSINHETEQRAQYIAKSIKLHDDLVAALKSITDAYAEWVCNQEAGNNDPETFPEIIAARAILAAIQTPVTTGQPVGGNCPTRTGNSRYGNLQEGVQSMSKQEDDEKMVEIAHHDFVRTNMAGVEYSLTVKAYGLFRVVGGEWTLWIPPHISVKPRNVMLTNEEMQNVVDALYSEVNNS